MIKKPKADEMTGQGKQEHMAPFAHFIISKKNLSWLAHSDFFFPGASAGELAWAGSRESSGEQLLHTTPHSRAPRDTHSPPWPPLPPLSSQGQLGTPTRKIPKPPRAALATNQGEMCGVQWGAEEERDDGLSYSWSHGPSPSSPLQGPRCRDLPGTVAPWMLAAPHGAHQVLVAHVGDVAADSRVLRVLAVLLRDVLEGAAPKGLLGAQALHLVDVDGPRPCRGDRGGSGPSDSGMAMAILSS